MVKFTGGSLFQAVEAGKVRSFKETWSASILLSVTKTGFSRFHSSFINHCPWITSVSMVSASTGMPKAPVSRSAARSALPVCLERVSLPAPIFLKQCFRFRFIMISLLHENSAPLFQKNIRFAHVFLHAPLSCRNLEFTQAPYILVLFVKVVKRKLSWKDYVTA